MLFGIPKMFLSFLKRAGQTYYSNIVINIPKMRRWTCAILELSQTFLEQRGITGTPKLRRAILKLRRTCIIT